MRRAFCFSRSWSKYSLSRMRPRPCWPGGYGLRSTGHFIVSHLAPLRNSFIRSRRQSRQTAPVYRAMTSDPPALGRATTVVRDRGDVLDADDLDAGVLDGADGGLTTGAGALHHHVDLAHAVLHGASRRGLRRELRGERRALAGTLEPHVARRGPRDGVPRLVGEGDDRVVERRLDVRRPVRDVLAFAALGTTTAGSRLGHACVPFRADWLLAGLLLPGHRLLGSLARARVRARALTVDGKATAVPQALVAADLDLALDVRRDFAAEVTFDLHVAVDERPQLRDLVLGEVAHARVGRDADAIADPLRGRAADAEDVGERDLQPLLAGDVDSRDSSQLSSPAASCSRLALTLLVARVLADDADRAVATDHLALLAHLLDRRTDLHRVISLTCSGR